MVIEAKLLGCELVLNENVQHKDEIWFTSDDEFDTQAYLYAARERFWNSIKNEMDWQPKISAYTTTLNCNDNGYPWKECIESMLGFANQVVHERKVAALACMHCCFGSNHIYIYIYATFLCNAACQHGG